jgi:hypothetical protein
MPIDERGGEIIRGYLIEPIVKQTLQAIDGLEDEVERRWCVTALLMALEKRTADFRIVSMGFLEEMRKHNSRVDECLANQQRLLENQAQVFDRLLEKHQILEKKVKDLRSPQA